MIFSDEDLKWFKVSIGPWSDFKDEIMALLARLEAAEKVISTIISPDDGLTESAETNNALEAWRKAAGK